MVMGLKILYLKWRIYKLFLRLVRNYLKCLKFRNDFFIKD